MRQTISNEPQPNGRQPAEPQDPPIKDPQPYNDPVEPAPGDPKEDRPMRDPVQPGTDVLLMQICSFDR